MQKKGHKFTARMKEGHVIVFTAYHGKSENRWLVTTNRDDYKYESLYNSDEIFLFIGWEDEEPYSIAELIEEYEADESHKKTMVDNLRPHLPNLFKESEETEVKRDIEWFVGQMTSMTRLRDPDSERKSWYVSEDDLLETLGRLDEPETIEQTTRLLESVLKENKRLGKLLEEKHEEWLELMDEINNQETLSEYWIEQKSIDTHVDTVNGEIQVTFILDDLKELLVPKQEITFEQAYEKLREESILSEKSFDYYWNCINDNVEIDEPGNLLVPKQELPVIPKFVAEWIEKYREHESNVWHLMYNVSVQSVELWSWLWGESNVDVLARAWLDGYTVEEEQKYVVKLPMSKNNDNQYAIVDYSGNIWIDALPSKYKLTEEEIRGLPKGDVLFEHFAVKVEELEE